MTKGRYLAVFIGLLAALHSWSAYAGPDIVGSLMQYRTKESDNLLEIARRFDLGFVELVAANPGVDPWRPEVGKSLLLPSAHILPAAPRRGIVINLAEQRLYFFPTEAAVQTYPIASGKAGCETPLGETHIVRKRTDPVWTPPASIRAERPDLPATVPPGPANPLGAFALDLAWPGYLIHGTNRPLGIGRRVTHGCIRMYPTDIATLFSQVNVGMSVVIVDQPVKLGWSGGMLFLEVHPTQFQVDELEEKNTFTKMPIPNLWHSIHEIAKSHGAKIDRNAVELTASERRGVPVLITP